MYKYFSYFSNHTCDSCGKTFVYRSELTRHFAMVHSGVRNHQCTLCGKAYCLSVNLKRHMETVHFGMPKKDEEAESKIFNFCFLTFDFLTYFPRA